MAVAAVAIVAAVAATTNRRRTVSNTNTKPPNKSSVAPKPRAPAWEVLEAQCPDHLECYECKGCHPLSDIQKFVKSKNHLSELTPCLELDRENRTAKFVHPNFSFTALRIIMKQYRQGKDCTELIKLLSYRSGVLMDEQQVKQIIATPQLNKGQIMMRVQTAYVVPPTHESRILLANKNHVKCPHTTRYTRNNGYLAWEIVKKFAALENLPRDQQEVFWSAGCKRCPAWFQVGLQHFPGEGTILFTTKWLNLGSGLSPLKCDIPKSVGPSQYMRRGGYDLGALPISLQFRGQILSPTSALTLEERQNQFRKSDSKKAQKKRARKDFVRKWWGESIFGHIMPHEFAEKGQ